MKIKNKIVVAVLLVSTLATLSCSSAFAYDVASNDSTDRYFYNFDVSTFEHYTQLLAKDNSTSVYCKVTSWPSGRSQCYVNVWGQDSPGSDLWNCNYWGNDRVIPFGKSTFIRNSVHEKNLGYVRLSFTYTNSDEGFQISGKWSPDSVPEAGGVII